jgi:hypothetical protein
MENSTENSVKDTKNDTKKDERTGVEWTMNKEAILLRKDLLPKERDALIEANKLELITHGFKKSHANGGRLEKFWVEDKISKREFLIKGASRFSYEPFTEKIAYIVGRNLGIDVLAYDIIPTKEFKGISKNISPFCKYASICERIDKKGYSITSVAEIKRARNAVRGKDDPPITNRDVMLEIMGKQDLDVMILFDAIIGNTDRHYGNVHILRDREGNLTAAPILDNGAGLMAQNKIFWSLLGYRVGKYFNRSSNMEKDQDLQMTHIDGKIKGVSFQVVTKTVEILAEADSTFKLMPKLRAHMVKEYLTYRLHKYLTMVKQGRYNDIQKEAFGKKDPFKDKGNFEKEHT